MTDESQRHRRTKVEGLIDSYGFEGLGEELERRWTSPGDDSESLRTLADEVNKRIVRATLTEVGERSLDGEVENLYRLLSEDVSEGTAIEVEQRLERRGIDVERLTKDFVSHQAIHTYLTTVRDASPPDDGGSDLESGRETVERLRNRLRIVTESTLSGLENAEEVVLGDLDVSVTVRGYCDECGFHGEVPELLNRGGCDCKESEV